LFDCTFQAKTEVKGRKVRGVRRKRRGRRKGKERRRARVAPSRSVPDPNNTAVSRARLSNLSHAHDRYTSWAMRRVKVMVTLRELRRKSEPGSVNRKRLVADFDKAKQRWVESSARRSGDPRLFVLARLRVLFSVEEEGWESLPDVSVLRSFFSFEDSGVGAIQQPKDYRAVPPPASLGPTNQWKRNYRSVVARARGSICRLCGEFGHPSSACPSPITPWVGRKVPPSPSPRGKRGTGRGSSRRRR
jgi:hypothetical protein